MTRCRRVSPRRGDDGFTLAESLVAMLVLVLLVAGFLGLIGTALRTARANHAAQVATGLGVEQLERARSLSWDRLAMTFVDDEAPLVDPDALTLLAGAAGTPEDEPLVIDPSGAVAPKTTTTVDVTDYTLWQYVTDAGEGLRRVVVLVTWSAGDFPMTHQASTLISEMATR